MPDESTVSNRKVEHLRINLEENVQFFDVSTGLEKYRFMHQALPELDLAAVDTSIELFGKKLGAPILVSSMTGGAAEAERINHNLAIAAQANRIAMGLGSQRAAIANASLASTYQVRDVAPDILLFANLGAIQLNYGYGVDECRRAMDMVDANALILHLNPIQEAVQNHGNTNWSGLLEKIEQVCRALDKPVVVKEVGFGISEQVARQLFNAGVSAIDVAGAGGTSWAAVESRRAANPTQRALAETFWDWGIPTAESLVQVRRAAPNIPIFASGGIRNGIEIAKCIALGATLVGLASPLLKLANVSAEAATEGIEALCAQLRVAMFGIGASNLTTLRDTPCLLPT
ncbi:MAG TPA: type 2 isopentenyl-diphosphate Delta-isomerase [Anaerolineae bacterium]|nr:type 2 isopentenyl-diphosphate Delta-isomerase [Anaerolineae bacterium]